ncbi:DUF4054 domain-containing protein [Candidatus Woesearchaeota archaeon]|nr:DUF4054 domain-containing protein [Candidatus Woesearchaeota archaeon]
MSVSPADVKDVAPELASQPDARIVKFIAWAKLSVNEDIFDYKYDLAVTYLVAHMMSVSPTTSGGAQQSQIVTSEKVGDLSRSYQESESSDTSPSSLSRTRYGTEFLRLRSECTISPVVVTGSGELNE